MKFFRFKNLLSVVLAFAGVQIVGGFFETVAFAQNNTGDEALQGFSQLVSVFINIFTFLALQMMEHGGRLLGTDFLTGSDPMSAIRPMWTVIRNITNIAFVLVLLFLAMSNLFSFGEGNWTIKEKLPKVILALIAINFSLLGFKVAIDAVNVGTQAILSISDQATEALQISNIKKLIYERKVDELGVDCEEGAQCMSFADWINDIMCDGDNPESSECMWRINPNAAIKEDPTSQNLFLAFGAHFGQLYKLPSLAAKAKSEEGKFLHNFFSVANNGLFSGILALAYVIAIFAVFIALIARMLVLWVAMAFSPILVAAWIMGFGGGQSEIGKRIVTNLIMPLKIAAAFTVSFIMVAGMAGNVDGFGNQTPTSFTEIGPALSKFATGSYGILWQIVVIVVFWKAAFWAMEGSEAETLIQGIQKGTEKVGTAAARAVTIDRPLFKTGENKDVPVSLSGMGGALGKWADIQGQQSSEQNTNLWKHMNILDDETAKLTKDFSKLRSNLKDAKTPGKSAEHISNIAKDWKYDDKGKESFIKELEYIKKHPNEFEGLKGQEEKIDKIITGLENGEDAYYDVIGTALYEMSGEVKYKDIDYKAEVEKDSDSKDVAKGEGEKSKIVLEDEKENREINFSASKMVDMKVVADSDMNAGDLEGLLEESGITAADLEKYEDDEMEAVAEKIKDKYWDSADKKELTQALKNIKNDTGSSATNSTINISFPEKDGKQHIQFGTGEGAKKVELNKNNKNEILNLLKENKESFMEGEKVNEDKFMNVYNKIDSVDIFTDIESADRIKKKIGLSE